MKKRFPVPVEDGEPGNSSFLPGFKYKITERRFCYLTGE